MRDDAERRGKLIRALEDALAMAEELRDCALNEFLEKDWQQSPGPQDNDCALSENVKSSVEGDRRTIVLKDVNSN